MKVRPVSEELRGEFNRLAQHPLQSWEWGEFRRATGIQVERYGVFDEEGRLVEPIQVSLHPIKKTPWKIGYFPKGSIPSQKQAEALSAITKKHGCVFVKCEPKVELAEVTMADKERIRQLGFTPGRPLFTKYTFTLDLSPSADELLAKMKSKTRYNLRLAQKKGVTAAVDNSNEAFEAYLRLTAETTKRQGFYAHGERYHRQMWKHMREAGVAHLMVGRYRGQVLTAWILFAFNNVLYYPYGASSRESRDVMASNLVMWEAILFGKQLGCTRFDMWGALGPSPDPKDPWYGFHRFKEGYGADLTEYIGTFDYVNAPFLYPFFRFAEETRAAALHVAAKIKSHI